jgi:dTDP-3-amino-3,4,6-trideoxy-alpha-D-glucose transaminase
MPVISALRRGTSGVSQSVDSAPVPPGSPILFNDLARGVEATRSELDAAVARVLSSGWFVLGTEGQAFEEELASELGARHAVGVASGTDAIELALRALELGPEDEVVTQANTCVPTVCAIERAGAIPVLCDVELEAGTMDPESLRGAIGERTRAVIPVHLYGQCSDTDAVLEACSGRDIAVVEDCAQAIGAELRGQKAGTIGALGCFSFYPTKNLAALGDGGAVVTDDHTLAERLRLVRRYGEAERYDHVTVGVNSRLDELQAAVLRTRLPRLADWNARRNEIAGTYTEALAESDVRALPRLEERSHVYHLYVVDAPDRDALQRHLDDHGIGTLIHYPKPVHAHPPYRRLGDGPVPLKVSERLCSRILSLPIYPELRDDEVERVAKALQSFA